MEKLKLTGGARIGWLNETIPFTTLEVSKEKIELTTLIKGKLIFKPEEVISVESFGIIPLIGKGIKINHTIPEYDKKVVFWSLEKPSEILKQIKDVGFHPKKSTQTPFPTRKLSELDKLKGFGFPIKIPFIVFVAFVWNISIMMDMAIFFKDTSGAVPPGKWGLSGMGIIVIFLILSLISKKARILLIKDNRNWKEVKPLILLVTILLLAIIISVVSAKGLSVFQ